MKNKKFMIIGMVLLIIIIIGSFYIFNRKNNNKYNDDIIISLNKNSRLPVDYMIAKADVNIEKMRKEYEYIDNYMSDDFYKDGEVSFSFAGYPNDESEYYLNEMTIYSNKYNVLGITIGNSIDEANDILVKNCYIRDESNEYKYTKENINIILNKSIENDKIDSIEINSPSEYLGNRIY